MQFNHLIRIPQLAAAFCTSPHGILKVGDVLRHSRRFTNADVVRYSEATGDRNPIHLDANFAHQIAGFDRGPIVHGMLAASLFPSVIASYFPGAIYTSQTLQFKLPVYIEDEVVAEMQTTNIHAIKEKYYVKWTTRCYTSNECLVIDGEATTILPDIALSKCRASEISGILLLYVKHHIVISFSRSTQILRSGREDDRFEEKYHVQVL